MEVVEENITEDIPPSVKKIEDCINIPYQAKEAVYEDCSYETEVCDDEPLNKSCRIVEKSNQCFKEMKTVQKTRKKCRTKGFVINDAVKLNTEEYECSPVEEDGKIVVICDSRFDGNGNGICSSGESCMKFVVDGSSFEKSEKNSRDDFTESDDSFFLEKVKVEVAE